MLGTTRQALKKRRYRVWSLFQFGSFFDYFIDGANHVERLFWQVVYSATRSEAGYKRFRLIVLKQEGAPAP